ncbi:30S ribosomal protein S5 [Candidatus Giovannonibacteria bacterium]|nr:30S ribosomal protein S5 [Candidatus Giovannonibacteria bacterium]
MADIRNRGFQKKSEFDQKMIDLRRVARVVAGGRRFSFRSAVILGDRKGRVGFGLGKGADASLAMDKAKREARKNMITVALDKEGAISFEVEAKFGAAKVRMRPSRAGRGLVAGGAVRAVLDLAGVKNTSAKVLSHTKNKINTAKAAIRALEKLRLTK